MRSYQNTTCKGVPLPAVTSSAEKLSILLIISGIEEIGFDFAFSLVQWIWRNERSAAIPEFIINRRTGLKRLMMPQRVEAMAPK
jgi:hypothetical protein